MGDFHSPWDEKLGSSPHLKINENRITFPGKPLWCWKHNIRFQTCFRSIDISLNMIKQFLVDYHSIQQFNIEDVYVFKKINLFRHLKLEIALAIPASTERKIETNNSAV